MSFSKLKSAVDVLCTVLVTLAAVFLLATQIENRWLGHSRRPQPQDVAGLTIEARKVRHMRGSGSIALVEFTDYECPFCRDYTRTTGSEIESTLIETGVIRHVVFNFPLESIHSRARKAGEAAECASRQGRYWEMHERLFSHQEALDNEALTESGAAVGVARQAFMQCLEGESTDDVAADLIEGRRLGVKSTPTFFIGVVQPDGSIQLAKRVVGTVSFKDLMNVIETVGSVKTANKRS